MGGTFAPIVIDVFLNDYRVSITNTRDISNTVLTNYVPLTS